MNYKIKAKEERLKKMNKEKEDLIKDYRRKQTALIEALEKKDPEEYALAELKLLLQLKEKEGQEVNH